jgi:hypothetical protein
MELRTDAMTQNGMASPRLPGTTANRAMKLVAAMLLISALLVPGVSAKSEEVVSASSGVSYVSGGAGTEAIDRLRSMERDFNLKLVFALDTGAYLADVDVTIIDASSNVLLKTLSEGPWLLAKVPAGNYQVSATKGGQAETRKVAVGSGPLRTVEFRWPPK